jgi:hypothetical protein
VETQLTNLCLYVLVCVTSLQYSKLFGDYFYLSLSCCALLCCMLLCCVLCCSAMLCNALMHTTMLCCAVSSSTLHYCALLCSALLYYTLLCPALLCSYFNVVIVFTVLWKSPCSRCREVLSRLYGVLSLQHHHSNSRHCYLLLFMCS